MDTISLKGQIRTAIGRGVPALRRAGKVPGIVYGHGVPRAVELERLALKKVYAAAGESTLVDLDLGSGAPIKALIQDMQLDPVSGLLIHVDFRAVSMTDTLNTDIPISFVGEAPAVKEQGGVLVKNMTSFKVQCLPGDLVHAIEVSLASLKAFGTFVRVKDITPPPGITITNELDTVVVTVVEPRSEEELKKLDEKVEADVSKVEVAKKEKKTDEEESAAPAAKEAAPAKGKPQKDK